jgi:hypothetical protein
VRAGRLVLVVVAAVGAWGPRLAAQQPSIAAAVDTAAMTVGDRITVTVTVDHDTSQTVGWPELGDHLGRFEVVGADTAALAIEGGGMRSTARYVLTAFELGDLEIPSIEVMLSAADGTQETLRTDPMTVTVSSVGLDPSGEIRDIKPPLEIPRNWLLLVPWVVALGALGVAGYWLYRRYRLRRRRVAELAAPPVPTRPAHEIAYEALDRLEASGLLERGEVKEYFIRVSEIIRSYLEGRYGIDAMDMTSHDVMNELEREPLERTHLDLFATFFERSDLVKFAKHEPSKAASVEMIPIARRLIDETLALLPAPDESQPEAAAVSSTVAGDDLDDGVPIR